MESGFWSFTLLNKQMAAEQYYLAALTCGVSFMCRIKEANCVLYVHLGDIWCSWVSCASLAIQFLANMPALPCVILNAMVAAYIVYLMYSVGRTDRPKADEPKGFNHYNLFTSGNKAKMKQLLSRCKDELTSKTLVTGIDSEVRRW